MIHATKQESSTNDVYILLTDTGTRFTKLIKTFTSAPYNHASIALDVELNELVSFGRKRPTEPWSAGFIEENVYEGTFRHFPNTRCALLRLQMNQWQRAAIVQSIQSFREKKDIYRYNLIGLFGVLLNIELAPKHSYFCSQFVAEVLSSSGANLWSRPSALVTPNDFLKHAAFEVVYEGLLYDYPLLDQGKLNPLEVGQHPAVVPAPAYQVKKQAV